jgi:hypothetical protein
MKIFLLTAILLFSGCAYFPLKPGTATIHTADGYDSTLKQSQNPQNESTQIHEKTTESADGSKTTEKTAIKIGAAQKDTARELAAKLGSLKGVVWVGVLVFLFGAASLFYPPLKLIVGSVTTSAAAIAAGLALIVLPTLIVGHEILIMAVALGAVGIWWFAHRHGGLRASVELLTKK